MLTRARRTPRLTRRMPSTLQLARFSGALRCAASMEPFLSAPAIYELAAAIRRISSTHVASTFGEPSHERSEKASKTGKPIESAASSKSFEPVPLSPVRMADFDNLSVGIRVGSVTSQSGLVTAAIWWRSVIKVRSDKANRPDRPLGKVAAATLATTLRSQQ